VSDHLLHSVQDRPTHLLFGCFESCASRGYPHLAEEATLRHRFFLGFTSCVPRPRLFPLLVACITFYPQGSPFLALVDLFDLSTVPPWTSMDSSVPK
jgi:hypothetical protein